MDGFGRSNLNAGNLFSSPKGLFDTNRPMELIDEPLAGMYHLFIFDNGIIVEGIKVKLQ